MHPVRPPALVHRAFENTAVIPGISLHLAPARACLLADGSRPDTRYLA